MELRPLSKLHVFIQHIYMISGTLYLAAAQAAGADIHFAVALRRFDADGLHICSPHFIGSSMRMADIIAKIDRFTANCTFCHDHTSLSRFFRDTMISYQKHAVFARKIWNFQSIFLSWISGILISLSLIQRCFWHSRRSLSEYPEPYRRSWIPHPGPSG